MKIITVDEMVSGRSGNKTLRHPLRANLESVLENVNLCQVLLLTYSLIREILIFLIHHFMIVSITLSSFYVLSISFFGNCLEQQFTQI